MLSGLQGATSEGSKLDLARAASFIPNQFDEAAVPSTTVSIST